MKHNDVYQWRIVYQDGAALDEYDEARPDGRGFAEREAKPVAGIALLGTAGQHHCVDLPPDAEPIFFRRRTVIINSNDNTETPEPTKHCIGWQRGNEAVYLFVLDDGSALLTTNFQAL